MSQKPRIVSLRTYQALLAWVDVFDGHVRELRNPIMRAKDAVSRFRAVCASGGLPLTEDSAREVFFDVNGFGIFDLYTYSQEAAEFTAVVQDDGVELPKFELLYLWPKLAEFKEWLESASKVSALNISKLVSRDTVVHRAGRPANEEHVQENTNTEVAKVLWDNLVFPSITRAVATLDDIAALSAGCQRTYSPMTVASASCPFCSRRIYVGPHGKMGQAVQFRAGMAGKSGYVADSALGYAHVECFNRHVVPARSFGSLADRAAASGLLGASGDAVDAKSLLR